MCVQFYEADVAAARVGKLFLDSIIFFSDFFRLTKHTSSSWFLYTIFFLNHSSYTFNVSSLSNHHLSVFFPSLLLTFLFFIPLSSFGSIVVSITALPHSLSFPWEFFFMFFFFFFLFSVSTRMKITWTLL